MSLDHVRAYILAGGKASRLGGRNKALIEVDGRPLIARLLEILGSRMPVTVVSDRAGDFAPFGVRVIGDRTPGLGPLGGIEAGLADSEKPYSLFLPCDLPDLTWAVLSPLVERCPGHDLTLYRHTHYEPLAAVYSSACLPRVRALIRRGRSRPIELLPLVRALEIPIRERDVFRNLNTGADLDDE